MKDVVIVGNGHVDSAQAKAIAGAQWVVRFNDCRSATGGDTRTDVVAVCNTGRPARAMLGSHAWRTNPAVSNASEIWCVRDPVRFTAIRPLLATLHPELEDLCDDYTDGFRRYCSENGKRCLLITQETHHRVDQALRRIGAAPYIVPSSGMIVIESVLERFSETAVSIAGFGHEGWHHHPFASEKRLVDQYVSAGRLTRI
ncbi:Urease operon accessory protein [Rhizobium leguminosarum]|uniref:Urease operon accessory protein n=1 Tax=Rhizobium TaxID=379 RepID=UPI00103139C9|nr:Urease operon accessory protein [Rhizobium leguminosarum]TBF87436.1 Urease operon accessory protein [Rhizobium leguminosarum]TBG07051.1 Urease operon accessory protein [Rhizobium leguminosarum]TBG07799.1 Urease operon accessory protein [Rhizobium leguminosarum]TBG30742.1 Urease operon accessory protein [Rhizobium leguminosarum]TBG50098.1 Urease operon accessory protein [Rhizobium leguminosarum]